MKNGILILIISAQIGTLFSQEKSESCAFKIFTGAKYTPIDYIGGGIFGVSLTKNKYSFTIRNDISLSIVKKNPFGYFGIDKYRVYSYFDVHYLFHKKLSASLGYGWISNKDEIHRFNHGYGYSSISIGFNYFILENIVLELKGDISFVDWNSPVNQNIAFPVAFGLIYCFD
jgi:hypothetical protein